MLRNRKAKLDAMILRAYVADALCSRNGLEPLSDKEIARAISWHPSVYAVGRARRWCEQAYKRDRLKGLVKWLRAARQGVYLDNE